MRSYDNYVRVCVVIAALTLTMFAGEYCGKGGLHNHHTKEDNCNIQTEEASADAGTDEDEEPQTKADADAALEPAVTTEYISRSCETAHMSLPVIEQECLIKNRVVMDLDEREILYRIVQAEAGGEDELGKKMVADVIMNRVQSEKFPNSVSEVVFQRSGGKVQFSPTRDGRIYRVRVSQETMDAVDAAVTEEDHTDGALYFVATSKASQDKVSWFERALTNKGTHGGHTFYR